MENARSLGNVWPRVFNAAKNPLGGLLSPKGERLGNTVGAVNSWPGLELGAQLGSGVGVGRQEEEIRVSTQQ